MYTFLLPIYVYKEVKTTHVPIPTILWTFGRFEFKTNARHTSLYFREWDSSSKFNVPIITNIIVIISGDLLNTVRWTTYVNGISTYVGTYYSVYIIITARLQPDGYSRYLPLVVALPVVIHIQLQQVKSIKYHTQTKYV